jgi:rhodanese-related sulfurtransferase
MSRTITVSDLAQVDQRANSQVIDVRSNTEFRAGHIPGAINIPMDEIESRMLDLDRDRPIVLICQAGQRARIVAGMLAPCRKDLAVLQGGTKAWQSAGLPLARSSRVRWSLERQVRLGAGMLVVSGVLLSWFVNPRWIGLSAFVGLGLCFAGLTDICPMGLFLSRMPWNGANHCKVDPVRSDGAQYC